MILKGMSWAKVSYNLIFDILALFCFYYASGNSGNSYADDYYKIIFFTFLCSLLAGILSFAITLHCGKINGILDLENHDRKRSIENVAVEMDSVSVNDTTVVS